MAVRRIKFIGTACILLFIFLLGRLVQVQLLQAESFTDRRINLMEASVNQRIQVLPIDNGRGKFLDKDGVPLGHITIPTLVLFPFLKQMDWPAREVSEAAEIQEEDLLNAVKNAKKPFAYGGKHPVTLTDAQMEKINSLKIPGVFAVRQSFKKKMPAEHLIGTLTKAQSQKEKLYRDRNLPPGIEVGNTGLQAAFDEFLLSEGESKLIYHVDGRGGPLFGVDVKYSEPANPLYPVSVVTTIDSDLQHIAETLVDQHEVKNGGMILLDIESSEIRAVVSRPAISKNDPNAHSENKMFSQEKIGSVFKTVVAAAAIDHGLAKNGRQFDCSLTINGTTDKKRPLGYLNFEESFAQSCNRTFGELAGELAKKDPKIIEEYARKLHLVGLTGWQGQIFHSEIKQLYQEDSGIVWDKKADKQNSRLAAHTGIGQQDVQVTPLAAANMMAEIARGGKAMMVKAVSRVEFKDGSTAALFTRQNMSGGISPYTAIKLQAMLREVVTSGKGTGRAFQGLPYEVAGKSGTAQTGKKQNGEELYNKWFAGYFPFKNPKYALVAVNLDVPENKGGINPLFYDMVKEIYRQENEGKGGKGTER
ncbi:peptidoglycan D,D-transpeptidase FtsI family protein [Peribacillus sp. SCS-26]|uniref:peptidoglycan D,D-transpeptidase FtsI family protein n=1 Tax=Paraperibacillus marinus TaxID=3115295 RepID=UPI0039060F7D